MIFWLNSLIIILIFISLSLIFLARNPVHSVLYLILIFFLSALILFLLGIDFLGLIFIIIYVGAIAVLFLFVIMMLNIKLTEIQENLISYLPLNIMITLLFFLEIILLIKPHFLASNENIYNTINWIDEISDKSTMIVLSEILYTYEFFWFIMSGFILLLAMLGSIVLTLDEKKEIKRQEIHFQISQTFWNTIRMFV